MMLVADLLRPCGSWLASDGVGEFTIASLASKLPQVGKA